ncbi:MAG: galactose mutarotase [Synoicihabitans sp.]
MSASSFDPSSPSTWASLSRQPFGVTARGIEAELFTLTNANGMRVDITNYGATIVRLLVPDRTKQFDDVVLGYDTLAEYEAGQSYFGTVVGRCGNRIAGGRFTLDGVDYTLPTNNEPGGMPCHLHGGPEGFSQQVWKAHAVAEGDTATLELTYFSPAGEMGYPGNLSAKITYHLRPENTLEVVYEGETDAPTLLNMTQHSYFNLAGSGAGDVASQIMQINASHYLPTSAGQIPLGNLAPVADTPFDFVTPHPLGAKWDADHPQIALAKGYDHTWVFDREGDALTLGAKVLDIESGRVMEIWTTEPGVQCYTGNWIPTGTSGKDGAVYGPRSGFCLETQHFPDAPNQPQFPPIVVRPGEPYRSETQFRFATT